MRAAARTGSLYRDDRLKMSEVEIMDIYSLKNVCLLIKGYVFEHS